MGYNIFDNLLYAVAYKSPPQIVQIGAQGQITYVRELPVQSGRAYSTGDVDEQGNFWVTSFGRGWVEVRLSDLTIIASGTAIAPCNVIDWAYVPGGGDYLYGLGQDTVTPYNTWLLRFDRTTHAWTTVLSYGNLGIVSAAWGAVYATADGFLYATENISGGLYRFALGGAVTHISTTSPPGNSIDGAHCILANA